MRDSLIQTQRAHVAERRILEIPNRFKTIAQSDAEQWELFRLTIGGDDS